MTLTIAAAAIKLTPLDFEGNRVAIANAINEAKDKNAKIICLPELCISGYGCEDAFFYDSVIEAGYESLNILAKSIDSQIAFIVGLPVKVGSDLFNCMAVVVNNNVKAIIPKQYLANDGVHYEKRWFTAWQAKDSQQIDFPKINNGQPITFGTVPVEIFGKKIAFEVCEDAWVATRPSCNLAKQNIDILFNPSASHFAFGKYKTRQQLTIEGSKITGATHVFVNQLGNEAGRTIYDGDIVIAKDGQIIAKSERLSFKERHVLTLTLDQDTKPIPVLFESCDEQNYYDFTKACALGLYDYLKKSGSVGFVLSLSGGADSAAVAILVKAMLHFLVKEHGLNDACVLLNQNPQIKSLEELTIAILHCVYQGTEQNSNVTRLAAKQVANELGAQFSEIELDQIINIYQHNIEKIIDQKLSWQKNDIAMQNIQARTRSPGIWMLANVKNALLLTTGNRSEAAVGYSTMDGDTSGSIAPIAGVSKIFIQKWLKWLQTNSVDGFGNFLWLKVITDQLPTAELRPLSSNQTDEKDLMPYAVLGFLEKLVIQDRLAKNLVINELVDRFGKEYKSEQLNIWVDKFYSHWAKSQWKRERLAPSFHLDTFSVDSRTWCRFPILSNGLN